MAAAKKPTSLRAIQRLMLEAVRQPLTRNQMIQSAWPDGRATADVAETFIKRNDRLASVERLQIYNQQYWWRLLGAFGEDFPGVRAVLGQRRFERLALAYLQAHPSRSWTLRNLGSQLPGFLAENAELCGAAHALAVDMARLEWARTVAFDEAELTPVDPQRLAHLPPEKLRFRLQPHLVLLTLRHPVDHLIAKLRQRQSEAASNAATGKHRASTLSLRARPVKAPIFIAAYRRGNIVRYRRLEPGAYRLLAALGKGTRLADACELAFAEERLPPERAAESVRTWFAEWTALHWLASLERPGFSGSRAGKRSRRQRPTHSAESARAAR